VKRVGYTHSRVAATKSTEITKEYNVAIEIESIEIARSACQLRRMLSAGADYTENKKKSVKRAYSRERCSDSDLSCLETCLRVRWGRKPHKNVQVTRVKGSIGGVTTFYIGNPSVPSGQCYFEWTGSTSTMNVNPRYYYAGSTLVAMRTGSSAANYIFGDHPSLSLGTGLSSTAITTDSSGGKVAEIRYYPWGTERYTSGTTPTHPSLCSGQAYHFTGQRLESGIGLYYYGA
jgi:hypothetical protein